MSLKKASVHIGLALSALYSGQSINGAELKNLPQQRSFPHLIAAHYHDAVTELLLPENCAPKSIDLAFDDAQGQQFLQKLQSNEARVDGTITNIEVSCHNGAKKSIGDFTMPVSSSTTLVMHVPDQETIQLHQRANSYSFQDFPGIELQLDAHHSTLPFHKLRSIEEALETLQSWGLKTPLKKVSIRKLDTPNAFSEVPSATNEGRVDEIVLSKQMLEEYSMEELTVILRHEMLHLIAESKINPAWDSVLAEVADRIALMNPSEQKRLSRATNESFFYKEIFSKKHQAEPHDTEEIPIMFFNTLHTQFPSLLEAPDAYKKAALDTLMQLSRG